MTLNHEGLEEKSFPKADPPMADRTIGRPACGVNHGPTLITISQRVGTDKKAAFLPLLFLHHAIIRVYPSRFSDPDSPKGREGSVVKSLRLCH
jgi:hypothetical protein